MAKCCDRSWHESVGGATVALILVSSSPSSPVANQIAARVVAATYKETLQGFVSDHADAEATVYTDDATAYETLPFDHDTVKHSPQEYVKAEMHTNVIKNLFVTDGAAFVTIGCANPTLTMMALARLASKYLADAAKRGELL
jgi:hypothetical protein